MSNQTIVIKPGFRFRTIRIKEPCQTVRVEDGLYFMPFARSFLCVQADVVNLEIGLGAYAITWRQWRWLNIGNGVLRAIANRPPSQSTKEQG